MSRARGVIMFNSIHPAIAAAHYWGVPDPKKPLYRIFNIPLISSYWSIWREARTSPSNGLDSTA